MEAIIGVYTYFTKLHFLDLKKYFHHEYFRDDFDYMLIKTKKGIVKISQDGLVYVRATVNPEDIIELEHWFRKEILVHFLKFDQKDSYFTHLLMKKKTTIILLEPEDPKKIFHMLDRDYDYRYKHKNCIKDYGEGLSCFRNIKYKKKELDEFLEYELIFSDYQNLVKYLFFYNHHIIDKAALLRKRETIRFKEIPRIINDLIDRRRETASVYKKITQLDDFIIQREEKCTIKNILKEMKLDDFHEMVRLNNYLRDQFDLTLNYIASTIDLTEFIYKDNEQKELNILQVIFAIGTIAAIVSLGAMPGAKFFFEISDGTIAGEMISFDTSTLVYWTLISVVIGVILFWILNYVFLYTKKLRIIRLKRK